jgi:hypothetical protein
MASLTTRLEIRNQIRTRGEFRSAYISDAELNSYINTSLQNFYDLVITADPTYYLDYASLVISTYDTSYALPGDFYKMVGVSVLDPVDGYSVLQKFEWKERYDPEYLDGYADFRYHIRGNQIYLQPSPPPEYAGATVSLEYIPACPSLTADGDSIDSINGWEEWIILDVLVACAAKEETDATLWTAQKAAIEARIKTLGARDIAEVKVTPKVETLRDLRAAIRQSGNWKREQITDAQITQFANASLSALRDIVCSSDPSYFIQYHNVNITSGNRMYNLPTDFYKVVGMDYYDAAITDGYAVMEHFNWEERYTATYVSTIQTTRYSVRGNNVYFQPTPLFNGIVRMEYVPSFTPLTSPSNTFRPFFDQWVKWVVADACSQCSVAVGTDPALYNAQRAEIEARINKAAFQDIQIARTPNNEGQNLESLRLAVRSRGAWTKEQLNNSQLTGWINSSIASFVDLISIHEPAYYLKRGDVNVVAGINQYALPTDFYKVIGVAVKDTSRVDGYSVMDRTQWESRYDDITDTSKDSAKYYIMGDSLYIHPTPGWSDVVRIEYIPYPTKLVASADTFKFYNGWEEYVILDTCVKVCALLKADPSIYLAGQQKMEARLVKNARIDIAKPIVVTDVYRGNKYFGRRKIRW